MSEKIKEAFYVHEDKLAQELQKLNQTKIQLQHAHDVMKDFIPVTWHLVLAVANKEYDTVASEYLNQETTKIEKLIELAGESVVTDSALALLEDRVLQFKQKLVNCYIPDADYAKYFTLKDGAIIRSDEYPDSYFEELCNVYLSASQEAKLKKHMKALDLLNELMQGFDNEYIAFDALFIKDLETGKLHINGNYYLNNNIE